MDINKVSIGTNSTSVCFSSYYEKCSKMNLLILVSSVLLRSARCFTILHSTRIWIWINIYLKNSSCNQQFKLFDSPTNNGIWITLVSMYILLFLFTSEYIQPCICVLEKQNKSLRFLATYFRVCIDCCIWDLNESRATLRS